MHTTNSSAPTVIAETSLENLRKEYTRMGLSDLTASGLPRLGQSCIVTEWPERAGVKPESPVHVRSPTSMNESHKCLIQTLPSTKSLPLSATIGPWLISCLEFMQSLSNPKFML
ncbi:unnamed protein product [Aspergillus oryzae]|nr:unnamed protein product [Aspergillus oryzae]GMF93444.1 unnamed protein product [Aspergillus oryzae]